MSETYRQIVKQWQDREWSTVEDVKTALENFRILFAYHSNVIENPEITYHDTREIFENGKVINFTGNMRSLLEIENQKNTFEKLCIYLVEKRELSPELIKKMHRMLMRGCYDEVRYGKGERPGEFKFHDYVTGDNVGSLPQDVPDEIAALCDEVNAYQGEDILTAAAYLHLNFEAIHPFADGNGRVGRTLLNYYLMTHHYPPTILFNEDKRTYYLALATFDKTGRIDGFVQFLKEQTIKTWERKPAARKTLSEQLEERGAED